METMVGKTERLRSTLFLLTTFAFGGLSLLKGATLTGTFTPIPQDAVVNLTEEGALDWVHWGLFTDSSIDRKAGVTPQIPDFIPIGYGGPYQFGDNFNGYSWSDGTPTASITNTITGVWMYGKSNGFELKFPADTTLKTLKIYVGTFGAVGKFTATLPGATSIYSDSSITNVSNGPGGVYTLDFAADAPGQILTMTYMVEETLDAAGNVTLQGAALTALGANNPPSVSISSPANDASLSSNDSLTITAEAADADGTIAKVEFFQGKTKLGESTGDPYSLVWSNVQAGHYVLTARATDNDGATSISGPVEIFVTTTGGVLSGVTALPPALPDRVDFTAEGTSDWAHWGLSSSASFDHRAGVPRQIGNFTKIGTDSVQRQTDNFTAFSWSEGTPTLSAYATKTAVFIHGVTNGFLLAAPAGTNASTLKVYVGLYGAEGKFQAYLSDFSAPAFTDTSLASIYGNVYAVYILNYTAASPGQTLTVRYTADTLYDARYGNVTLQAATLSGGTLPTNVPPAIAITSPADGTTLTAPANITITADASDSDGTIDLIEFLNGTNKLGEVTAPPYTLTWRNVTAGSYTLTAKATDNLGNATISSPVNVTVTDEAAPLITLEIPSVNAGRFSFSFTTASNRTYTIERTLTLIPVNWQPLTNLLGDGSMMTVTDSIPSATQQFYRAKTP